MRTNDGAKWTAARWILKFFFSRLNCELPFQHTRQFAHEYRYYWMVCIVIAEFFWPFNGMQCKIPLFKNAFFFCGYNLMNIFYSLDRSMFGLCIESYIHKWSFYCKPNRNGAWGKNGTDVEGEKICPRSSKTPVDIKLHSKKQSGEWWIRLVVQHP